MSPRVAAIITFADDDLRQLCSTERLAKRRIGSKNTKKLKARLADLQVAANVSQLVAGRPHPLKGDRAGQFALDLDGGCRLVFAPANDTATAAGGVIDWSKVTEVKVLEIGDYHD